MATDPPTYVGLAMRSGAILRRPKAAGKGEEGERERSTRSTTKVTKTVKSTKITAHPVFACAGG